MRVLIINCSPVKDGATAEIQRIAAEELSYRHEVTSVNIDDFTFDFCSGCRVCHKTAKCVKHDDAQKLMELFEGSDIIVCVSPSYWADVPGQFKAFIDRCTPWCNTHEPHAKLSEGKKGYVIALRTGPGMKECERIFGTIEHFYGHLEIECCGRLGLCEIEYKEAVEPRKEDIADFCGGI